MTRLYRTKEFFRKWRIRLVHFTLNENFHLFIFDVNFYYRNTVLVTYRKYLNRVRWYCGTITRKLDRFKRLCTCRYAVVSKEGKTFTYQYDMNSAELSLAMCTLFSGSKHGFILDRVHRKRIVKDDPYDHPAIIQRP